MKTWKWLASTPLLLVALGSALPASAQEASTFEAPMVDASHRLDLCLTWGQGCGEEAADAFCAREGFAGAVRWDVASDIGDRTPTRTLGDDRVCDQGFCDGFASITCEADAPQLVQVKALSSIDLENGATVEFLEPEPGVVLVVERGAYGDTPKLARLALEEDATPTEVFRALAPDRPVPDPVRVATVAMAPEPEEEETPPSDALDSGEEVDLGDLVQPEAPPEPPKIAGRPAEPRPMVVQAKPAKPKPPTQVPAQPRPDADDTGKMEPAEEPRPPSGTRAEWFQKELCPAGSGRDVTWCWVNRSGNSSSQVYSIGIVSTVYSCGGTTKFGVMRRRLGKWKSYGSWDILPGHYATFRWLGAPRTRRSSAQGTCHHHGGVGVKL